MRIGNQTALAADDMFEPYRFALAYGFGAFEWFSDHHTGRGFDFDQLSQPARADLRQAAESHNMRFSVHAPFEADPTEHGGDIALQHSIDFAADIGAGIVVLHMNANCPPREYLAALVRRVRCAQAVRVRLAIENTVHTPPETFNALFDDSVMPAEARPALGMCLDIGHANLCPATRHDYVGYLDRLAPNVPIIHAHLHENFGDQDSHLTLFTGPAGADDMGVRGVLRRLVARGYDESLILEQWPDPPELLVTARDRLCALLAELSVQT